MGSFQTNYTIVGQENTVLYTGVRLRVARCVLYSAKDSYFLIALTKLGKNIARTIDESSETSNGH